MKPIAPYLKYLKYLFWLGPMLVLAGVSAGIISGTWTIPMGMMIAGMVVIGLWLLYVYRYGESAASEGFWRRRSTQVSANALIATLSMLAILGLVNFLGARNVARLDLTENQLFTLAPETQQLVRNLPTPVKVWVFSPQAESQDRELLESFRRQSPRFSYEFVDPNMQPTLVQRLEVKSPGDVIVDVPETARKQFVQNVALTDTTDVATRASQRLSEAKLANAIAQATITQQFQVYFLQGHGERPLEEGRGALSQAVKGLADRNYIAQPLNLAQSPNFPTDADVVVVAGPRRPLLDAEVTALKTYSQRGGNLLLLIDPNTDPKLEPLLTEWGVKLDPRAVIDASGAGRLVNLSPIDPVVIQYGDHPITRDFTNSFSFYPLARPVDTVDTEAKPDAKPAVKSTPLLYTSDRSWAESNLQAQPLEFNPAADRQGPFILGVALSRSVQANTARSQASPSPNPTASPSLTVSPSPDATASPLPTASPTASPTPSPTATQSQEARLVVIGNSTFATDGPFNQPQVVNGDVFLNSVRWLSQQDQQTLSIRAKDPKNRRLSLTNQEANLVGWLALLILPLLGFGAAFAVWWKRR
jgi:ABC-type uncharacterized transport system involved in gliding motility auxiliary subunit